MSSHHHIVLRVDQEQAESWSPLEVIECWNTFFTLPVLITRFIKDECTCPFNCFTPLIPEKTWQPVDGQKYQCRP